jgi:hypothetical protein
VPDDLTRDRRAEISVLVASAISAGFAYGSILVRLFTRIDPCGFRIESWTHSEAARETRIRVVDLRQGGPGSSIGPAIPHSLDRG